MSAHIQINLLPRPKRKIRQIPVILLLGILAIGAGSWYLVRDYQATVRDNAALEAQIQAIKAQKEALQQTLTQASQKPADKVDATAYLALPQLIRNASVSTDFLLDRLAELLPAGSVISTVEFKEPDQVKVSGKFSTVEEAVSFIQAVDHSAYFAMAKIGSVSVSKDQKALVESVIGQKVAPFYMLSFELTVKKNQVTGSPNAQPAAAPQGQ
ncbi:PilN domain-containing protein [Brevibacillus fluminis]|uniref:PilN domain-containing protein n=1 Tax=Brevibacillus fluminis TaxID=511487 RepID=UPI003F8A891C